MFYKFCFYVPETHLEAVKAAIFSVGAGKLGNYDCCAWQTKGQGQFRPLENSNPFIGKLNELETVDEYLVETICDANDLENVIAALKQAHPYEMPDYQYWKVNC